MKRSSNRLARAWAIAAGVGVSAALAAGALIDMTMLDFYLPGTQVGELEGNYFFAAQTCAACHDDPGASPSPTDPYSTWSGSLMGLAGRDPLFFAQLTLANQDVANVGNFCLRCHAPMSFVTGHAAQPDGSTLDNVDLDGVTCHLCHSMVDPVYQPGVSPLEDLAILSAMTDVPEYYGNAAFVLDPTGLRRGPRVDAAAMHEFVASGFFKSGNFCGTCHDVGNVATERQADGTYRYNLIGQPAADMDPWAQFPLERTYTEWLLSDFANGGVDMQGKFGGVGVSTVSSCQDCHMPRVEGRNSPYGPLRPDLATHEFAGAAAQVLDLIALDTRDDPFVDQAAIARGRAAAVRMMERAAVVTAAQENDRVAVRIVNESGHKLPTGHIEGRRVWINVQFTDADGSVIGEYGRYDEAEALLDETTTTVYEMIVGLSPAAAAATGLSAGRTGHMALADTIVKDNRIPPRGFVNAAYEAGGAPVVGASYADGQYWDDAVFRLPPGAAEAIVSLYYQNTPRGYIEHLRDANTTDQRGQHLHTLWEATGSGRPILMASTAVSLTPACHADWDENTVVDVFDLLVFLDDWFQSRADVNVDHVTNVFDLLAFLDAWFTRCA